MTKTWVATTAKWIAASRARETERPDRLFSDPYAATLAGKVGKDMMARSEQVTGKENQFLPVRTRYFDDLLIAGLSKINQVVILGAGFDTRAFRLPLESKLRIFELDMPQVFMEKESILDSMGAKPRCQRQCVPADLNEAWIAELLAAGFATGNPSLWIAEGLFFYLSPSQVDSLLKDSASLSAPGSLFAADFSGTGILTRPELQAYLTWLETRGELPPFCHDDPFELFASNGWRAMKVVQAGQPEANYGRLPLVTGAASSENAQTYLVTGELGF